MWYVAIYTIGLISGLLLYRYTLDKAEIVNNYESKVKIKQKKGNFWNKLKGNIKRKN